jgi:peptidyl-prolyl cis-trans isomerase A (cyclophilin A)
MRGIILCASVAAISFYQTPDYCLSLTTSLPSAAPVVIRVTSQWAPLGAHRLRSLVSDAFFDNSAIFRVVPDFVLQFGIAADHALNVKWNETIKDDPVKHTNAAGTISYATAGNDTRTTQLFVNLVDNPALDARGFAPVGYVVSGMDTLMKLVNPTPGDGGGIDQDMYIEKGNKWLIKNYPNTTFITKCTFVKCA